MPAALLLASEGGFTVTGPHVITSFELFGMTWNLTETVFIQWIVMLVLLVVMLILTHKMEVIPKTKRQAAAEWLVTFVRNMVDTTMGPKYKGYTTYIGALLCFLLLNNLMSLFGLKNPTSDISVTGAIALITFTLTQINRARTGKLKGFLHAFIEPMPFMLPFNIIGEIANPLSQALRIFGNMVARYGHRRTDLFRAGQLRDTRSGNHFAVFRHFLGGYPGLHLHHPDDGVHLRRRMRVIAALG